MPANTTESEKRLWDAADEFQANSKLKSSEYSVLVLGLIFLRYADHNHGKGNSFLAAARGYGGKDVKITIERTIYAIQCYPLPSYYRWSLPDLWALFLLISDVLQTRDASKNIEELLDAIAANQRSNDIAFAFAIYGFALMVPAVVGLIHLLKYRSVALGHIGGALSIIGLIRFAFIGGTEFLLFGGGADPSLNRDAILALNDRIGASLVYNLINLTEIFGFVFGLAILGLPSFEQILYPVSLEYCRPSAFSSVSFLPVFRLA